MKEGASREEERKESLWTEAPLPAGGRAVCPAPQDWSPEDTWALGAGDGPWGLEGGPGDPHSPTDQWGVLTGSLLIALEMSDREGGGNVCTWKAEGKIGLCELNRAVDWPSPSPYYHHAVVVVQSLSRVRLFATPRTAAFQASLSFTSSWGLLEIMFIELVMPSNHLIMDPIGRWVSVEAESVTRGQGSVEMINCVGKIPVRGGGSGWWVGERLSITLF